MDVVSLLKRYNIRPSKGLGQSFLRDDSVLDRIVAASELKAEDIVLEVGPGLGLLTRRLAQQASAVVAVELDPKMIAVLNDTLGDYDNVHLIQADILKVDPVIELVKALGLSSVAPLRYKMVGNLPYYITSAILRHLLGHRVRPEQLTLMVQREVAARITASPGKLSLLALSVQVYGKPEVICRVPAAAFYPRPKVDSALLRIRAFRDPRIPEEERPRFFQTARAGFGQKRKQLHNSLTHNLHLPHADVLGALEEAGIAASRRPQTLDIEEWAKLARGLRLPGVHGPHGAGNATTTVR